jgi:hypothetical protein
LSKVASRPNTIGGSAAAREYPRWGGSVPQWVAARRRLHEAATATATASRTRTGRRLHAGPTATAAAVGTDPASRRRWSAAFFKSRVGAADGDVVVGARTCTHAHVLLDAAGAAWPRCRCLPCPADTAALPRDHTSYSYRYLYLYLPPAQRRVPAYVTPPPPCGVPEGARTRLAESSEIGERSGSRGKEIILVAYNCVAKRCRRAGASIEIKEDGRLHSQICKLFTHAR